MFAISRPHWRAEYLLRVLNALGIVLIYCAVFLYEDREGRIQNLIAEWWVKVDDARLASNSRTQAFLQGVARLTVGGFDRVIGNNVLSFRFAGVSLSLSIASFFFIAVFGAVKSHQSPSLPLFGAILFILIGILPGLDTQTWVVKVWGFGLIFFILAQATGGFLFFVYFTFGGAVLARGVAYIVLAFMTSFACDVCYVALTRWMLRRVAKGASNYWIALMVPTNLVSLGLLLLGPIALGIAVSRYWQTAGSAIMLSFCLNAVDIFAGSAALILALTLLSHRLFWPVIQRPLYAFQRYRVITNKKFLWAAGLALATLPTNGTLSAIGRLLAKF